MLDILLSLYNYYKASVNHSQFKDNKVRLEEVTLLAPCQNSLLGV